MPPGRHSANLMPAFESDLSFLESTMPLTEQQLLQILPNAGPRAGVFVSGA